MPASPHETLEKLASAAAQRGLAGPTLSAYQRTWRQLVIHAASQSLDVAALSKAKAAEFYTELTRERGASHHLQTKAAISFLYRVFDVSNPFRECLAPKFRPETVEIQHLQAGDLSKMLLELRRGRRTYLGRLQKREKIARQAVILRGNSSKIGF